MGMKRQCLHNNFLLLPAGTIDDILSPMEDNPELPQAEAVDDGNLRII